MTKYKILFFVFLLITSICNGQKKAVTESGDEVILYENGTWKYTKDFDPHDSTITKTNSLEFTKSRNASFLLKATNGNVGFWIDPKNGVLEKQ